MNKLIFVFIINLIIMTNTSFAQNFSCTSLEKTQTHLTDKTKSLKIQYPNETTFYDFGLNMTRGATAELAGYYILLITRKVQECTKSVTKNSCDLVAQKAIELIQEGLNFCEADREVKCGLC